MARNERQLPAIHAWKAKIEEYASGKATGRKMTGACAAAKVSRDFPEMREAVVAEANAHRTRR